MKRQLWHIKICPLFSWLEKKEQIEVAPRSEMVSCRRNTRRFLAEETTYDSPGLQATRRQAM